MVSRSDTGSVYTYFDMLSRRARTLMLIVGLVATFPSITAAQANLDISSAPLTFNLSVDPQHPAPYTSVIVTPITGSVDVSNATITVSMGTTKIYQGNAQPISVPIGAAGVPVTITVTATDNTGAYSQAVTVIPEDVALVAEPVSSMPILYPGKPLVPLEGDTRIVAVANFRSTNGKALDPASLSYVWTVDNTLISDRSGFDKNSIVVASPLQYRQSTVSVTVQNADGSLVGSDSLTLSPQEPTLRIYEDDPLLGIRYDHALSGTFTVPGVEDTFYAAPYSFASSNGAPALQWYLNNTAAQTGNLITLRPTGSGAGDASLSIVASAGQFTNATVDLSLSFGNNGSSGLFGL